MLERLNFPPKKIATICKYMLQLSLGLILLGVIVVWVKPEKVLREFQSLDWKWLLVTVPLYVLSYLFGGFGMYALFPPSSDLSKKHFFKIYLFTQNMGTFLPLQLGESSLVLFVKKHRIPYSRSVVVFMINKLISLIVLMLVNLFGVWVLLYEKIIQIQVPSYWIFGLLLIGSLLVIVPLVRKRLYLWIGEKAFFKKWCEPLSLARAELVWSIKFNKTGIATNFGVTMLRRILIDPMLILMFFKSLGISPPFGKLILIYGLLSLISLIPLTAHGMGITEIGALYFFSLIGLEHAQIISYSLLGRVVILVLSGIFLGVYVSIFGFPKLK